MAIDWRKISKVRETARGLIHQFKAAPEVVAMCEATFDDWPSFLRRVQAVAAEDRGAALYTIHDVAGTTGLEPEALAPLIARGTFPAPIFDEPDMLWLRKDIVAWKAQK